MTSNFFIHPKNHKIAGLVRDLNPLNPGPLAPEARIIPLDQRANNTYRQAEIYISQYHHLVSAHREKIIISFLVTVCE